MPTGSFFKSISNPGVRDRYPAAVAESETWKDAYISGPALELPVTNRPHRPMDFGEMATRATQLSDIAPTPALTREEIN